MNKLTNNRTFLSPMPYSDCVVEASHFSTLPLLVLNGVKPKHHIQIGVINLDRLCGLVVRVLDYRYRGPGFDSRALPKKKKSSVSGTGSTQPREYN
jgi:hypothetical protein